MLGDGWQLVKNDLVSFEGEISPVTPTGSIERVWKLAFFLISYTMHCFGDFPFIDFHCIWQKHEHMDHTEADF